MACARPADDIESMPPPWPGNCPRRPGPDMESGDGLVVVDVDESAGGASGAGSNAHYNQPATRTNHLQPSASEVSRAGSASEPPEAASPAGEDEVPETLPTESELQAFLAAMIISESGSLVAPPSDTIVRKPTNILNARC